MRHDESAGFVPVPHPKTACADVVRAEEMGRDTVDALATARSGWRASPCRGARSGTAARSP